METNDYKKFKFFNWNREIDESNIKNKIKLIKQNGYEPTQPILVSSKFEIWDGQHRFIACKRLGVPVHFKITDDMSEERIKMINSNTRRWDLTDNITSNAKKGMHEYQFILDIMKDYHLHQTTAIIIATKTEITASDIRKIHILSGQLNNFMLEQLKKKLKKFVVKSHQFNN